LLRSFLPSFIAVLGFESPALHKGSTTELHPPTSPPSLFLISLYLASNLLFYLYLHSARIISMHYQAWLTIFFFSSGALLRFSTQKGRGIRMCARRGLRKSPSWKRQALSWKSQLRPHTPLPQHCTSHTPRRGFGSLPTSWWVTTGLVNNTQILKK
jgi:hypothetical protein